MYPKKYYESPICYLSPDTGFRVDDKDIDVMFPLLGYLLFLYRDSFDSYVLPKTL